MGDVFKSNLSEREGKFNVEPTPSQSVFFYHQQPDSGTTTTPALLIRKLANYVNANCRLLLRNVIFMDINH